MGGVMSGAVHAHHRSRRRQRGQGLVEFALVGPVLLLLAFGVFDFGRGMSANVTVTNSAREGARYLALNAVTKGSTSNYGTACYGTGSSPSAPTPDSGQGKAWRQLQDASVDLTQVTMIVRFYKSSNDPATGGAADITVTCSGGTVSVSNPNLAKLSPGDWVQVEVDYKYSPSTPLISHLVSHVSMARTTTMVLE